MAMHIPFSSLSAFEAAARLLSFKDAAQELHLSPSAVSHAIAKLERDLGALLFEREGRRLALTHDGRLLHGPVEEALNLIRGGLRSVSQRQSNVLRLHSAPSFAAQWLTPRLQAFLAAHPGMEVEIAADPSEVRFTNDEYDADIAYGRPEQDGLVIHSLGPETLKPMCAPAVAARVSRPSDLAESALIHSTMKVATWRDWFRANELKAPLPAGMRFDRSFMAIAAAADGLGVCLESTRLAEKELASGRLVTPLDGISRDVSETHHFFVYPKRNAERPVVLAFARWLLGELSLSGEGARD